MTDFGAIEAPIDSGQKKSIWADKNISIKSGGDPSFIGNIQRIDDSGLVVIKFNKPIAKVENLT